MAEQAAEVAVSAYNSGDVDRPCGEPVDDEVGVHRPDAILWVPDLGPRMSLSRHRAQTPHRGFEIRHHTFGGVHAAFGSVVGPDRIQIVLGGAGDDKSPDHPPTPCAPCAG